MNRATFLELKEKTEAWIAKKNSRAVELQHTIEDSAQKIAINTAAMNEAEQKDDPEAYQAAFALRTMYKDRQKKAEEERAVIFRDPVIPLDDWKLITEFLGNESNTAAEEERAEIWGLISRIEEIIKNYDSYYQELAFFANECDSANKAGYTGDFRPISVSRLPVHWVDGIKESAHFFRPKNN